MSRPVRLTLVWTEQALAAHQDNSPPLDNTSDDYPFDGPALDADGDTMAALERACVLARLDKVRHEGMSLEDSHEEGWFDLDQLDALIAELELLLKEARAPSGGTAASPLGDPRVAQWLEAAIAFSREAKRLKRGVCFWL